MKIKIGLSFAAALLALASVAGCSDEATDPIVNTITCNDVCRRYADCFDASYDVDGGTNEAGDRSTTIDT